MGNDKEIKRNVPDPTAVSTFKEDPDHDESAEVDRSGINRYQEGLSSVLAEYTKDIYDDDEDHIVFLDQESELGFLIDDNGDLVKNEHSRRLSDDITQEIHDVNIPAITYLWYEIFRKGESKTIEKVRGKQLGNRFFSNDDIKTMEKIVDHTLKVREKSVTAKGDGGGSDLGIAEAVARMRTTGKDGSVREEEYIFKK